MSGEAPAPEGAWHKGIAIEQYNHAYDLMDQVERTVDEDVAMVTSSFASRFHWDAVGTDQNRVIGDWQIGQVLSRVGAGDLALVFAERALGGAQAEGGPDWLIASTLEGVARAHAARGDDEERDRHLALARAAVDAIADPEDRALIDEQLRSVPGCAG